MFRSSHRVFRGLGLGSLCLLASSLGAVAPAAAAPALLAEAHDSAPSATGSPAGEASPEADAASAAPAPPAAPREKEKAPGVRLLAPLSQGEEVPLPEVDERIPDPRSFLGYPLGARFTPWSRIVDYLEALAAASPRVKVQRYGETYEGRPLELVAISTPENLERLEEIRRDVASLGEPGKLTSGERDRLVRRTPVIVWLAYGVHGNESSSAEAAMGAAYLFAAGTGEGAKLLDDVIVVIDPLVNPDGRERYVQGFLQRLGRQPNPRRSTAEHFEPWPGGRYNHYVIDLNRDWAWATQQETRFRLAAYKAWEPQVYVDFHEMGAESSYFFPPPAEPIHPQIDRRVISWLDTFGRANAEAFDREGWIYFKSESYDYFYPGYGDTYPGLRGAVGMTYEMAGGGRAGQALTLSDGSTLTLADRVARHLTTSLSTVSTAARNRRKLLEDFIANRAKAASDPVRTFLWPGDQQEARALAELLALHGVRVRQLPGEVEAPVRSLSRTSGDPSPKRFPAGSFAVSTAQPLGNLIEALLDLESPMSKGFVERQRSRLEQNLGEEFYDITAWSLPLAYNVRVWVAAGEVGGGRPLPETPAAGLSGEVGDAGPASLGFLVPPQGMASYRFAAALAGRGLRYRIALAPFSVGAETYPSGTLFLPRYGNPPSLREELQALAGAEGVRAEGVATSFELKGLSLGSRDMAAVRPSRVGLLSGEGIDTTSFGFLWHLLDRGVGLPVDRIDSAQLRQVPLADYDVLVLPSGELDDRIGEKQREALDAWVKDGGVLVAVGDSVAWLQDHELTSIKRWKPKKVEGDEEKEKGEEDPEISESPVERQLGQRPLYTPGAILATRMQAQHPLTLGLASAPPVLVEGTLVLRPTGDPRKDALVAIDASPVLAGFAWPEAEERLAGSLQVGVEGRGRGSVVLFAQEPAYRLFWRGTAPLFLNAVLYGPSAGLGGRQ